MPSSANPIRYVQAAEADLGIPESLDRCFEMYHAALQEILGAAEFPFRNLGIATTNEIARTYKERRSDSLILTSLFEKLCSMRPEDPSIRILEIGGGITLALKSACVPNYVSDKSAPWLSRALKKAFPDLVDVTVTDKQPQDFEHLVALTRGDELMEHFTISAPLADDFHPYTSEFSNPLGDIKLDHYRDSISLHELKSLAKNSITTLPDPLFNLYETLSLTSEQDLRIRLLPVMNENVESVHYGIKLITGIDMQKLTSSQLEGGFDFVFGRHLYPLLTNHMGRVREDVTREILSVLNPNGIGIVSFDGSPELVVSRQIAIPRLPPDE